MALWVAADGEQGSRRRLVRRRLDLPPEFAHPANRPRHPGLRGSERILLIYGPADEAARFHAVECLRTQAGDDRPEIQLMHLGELPRPELVR